MAEESQYLSFHGIRVHFRIAAPEGEIRDRVLLLSSPLISTFHWRKLVPELTQLGCLTVLVDLPGFGKSDCSMNVPQDGAMRANLVWGVLDEIDSQSGFPGSTWHLVGHGSACAAILEMGALYPDSVKSQVHIAPLLTTQISPKAPPPARWFRETVFIKDNFRRMVEHYSGYPMDDYIIDRMRNPLLRPGAQESFLRMVRAGERPPECGLGFCPSMVLIGGRDAMMTPPVRADISRNMKGAETHVLQSAGHFPMETHSKALRDYLRGWIKYIALADKF
ncbi:MAG: alpha/beta hydrolase [Clostridia bacterium]|nr:alpha/beta hydrolase [Clostridia bacterium]